MTNKSGCISKPSSRFLLQLCRACRTSSSNRIPVLRLFIFNSVCALGAISYSAHPLNCEGLTKTQRLCAGSQVPQERVTIKIHFADSVLIAVDVLWGNAARRATERNVNAIVRRLNFNPFIYSTQSGWRLCWHFPIYVTVLKLHRDREFPALLWPRTPFSKSKRW